MPQVAIGFLPDIGGTYFLSRLENHFGLYLALTGRAIGPADAYRLRLITHYIPAGHFHVIKEAVSDNHPIDRLLDGLHREREVLAALRSEADRIIDTSALNVHQLTDQVAMAFGTPDTTRLNVTVVSFGFKYGIPVDADFVADMRFLPNPYWVPELRPFTGQDEKVADYVKSRDGAAEFLDGYVPVLLGVLGAVSAVLFHVSVPAPSQPSTPTGNPGACFSGSNDCPGG